MDTSNSNTKQNIIIQHISEETLTMDINGEVREIRNQLDVLKDLLQNLQVQKVQYAEKIYNIEHIDEANFGVVTSNRVFNGVLCKELINIIKENPRVKRFLEDIPPEDIDNWECVRLHLKEAQRLLENSFVWIIAWEIRRLFSIGNDKQKRTETKIDEYINHCFSTYRISLQLVNYLFLSKLWDKKKKSDIQANKKPIEEFFLTNRILKFAELRELFQTLLEVFEDNSLDYPIDKTDIGDISTFLDPASNFNEACSTLEELESMDPGRTSYGLGHCHTAEIALSTILTTFRFFTSYQLVSMRKVEYEQMRNTDPRYVKDFSILEKKDSTKKLQRILKYDNKPSQTYAILFRNERYAINLFPFLLDYNALTGEQDFQIYFYESRLGESGLRYYSIKREREENINYRAAELNVKEIKSDEEKMEEQKNIRLDLVIKQFEEALNTILDKNVSFKAIDSTMDIGEFDNL